MTNKPYECNIFVAIMHKLLWVVENVVNKKSSPFISVIYSILHCIALQCVASNSESVIFLNFYSKGIYQI